MEERIAIIGLGKLGLPFAVCWAERGHEVMAVDISPERVLAVNDAKVIDHEPRVQELLEKNQEKITATVDMTEGAAKADVIFLFVGTPGEENGKFTTKYVRSAVEQIAESVKDRKDKPLIVLVSSVTAGSIEEEIIPALEKCSGKKVDEGFDFCYSPVFIALGTMVRDYLEPDMTLIGESSSEAGDRLESILRKFYTREDVPVMRTNFVNAEIIKLTLSTFITTKITYANMLAQLCAKIPGADADVVAEAIGMDRRVSPKVLKGGMPYGGPCFPRDNRALLYLTKKFNVDGSVVRATDATNMGLTGEIADEVVKLTGDGKTAGVLGLSFKPDTDVVDESASMDLVDILAKRLEKVVAYDPEAMEQARSRIKPNVTLAGNLAELVVQADVLVVATPWNEFKDLPESLKVIDKGLSVIDPWRLFKAEDFGEKINYFPIGRNTGVAEYVEKESIA